MREKHLMSEVMLSVGLFLICAVVTAAVLLTGYLTSIRSERLLVAVEIGRAAVEELKLGEIPSDRQGEYDIYVLGDFTAEGFDGEVQVFYGDERLLTLPCATMQEVA